MNKIFLSILFLFVGLSLNAQWSQTSCPTGGAIQCMAVSGTNIFAGSQTGGVFLSTDNGSTWTAVNTGLTTMDVLSLAISGSNIFAGTNGGGVFLSTNNGSNWTAVNTGLMYNVIHAIGINGTNIFAGTTSGGVFLSTNNGGNWSQISNGLNGVTVVWSFAISGNNVFAGTDWGGVYLTANNGNNWTLVNTGLPNQDVKALTVMGTNLFAAVNNGGVFLSTNNGTSWALANTGIGNLYPTSFLVNGTDICTGTINDAFISVNNGTNWTSLITSGLDVWSMAIDTSNMFLGTWNNGVWTRPLNQIFSGINENPDLDSVVFIYPNPFSYETTLRTNNNLKNATLTICNSVGQQVKQIKNISGQTITLHRDNLSNGIYFLRLTQENKVIATNKLVISGN